MYTTQSNIKLLLTFCFFVLVSYTSFLSVCVEIIRPGAHLQQAVVQNTEPVAAVLGVSTQVVPEPVRGEPVRLFNSGSGLSYQIGHSATFGVELNKMGLIVRSSGSKLGERAFIATNTSTQVDITGWQSMESAFLASQPTAIKVLLSCDGGNTWQFKSGGSWQKISDYHELLDLKFNIEQIENPGKLNTEDLLKLTKSTSSQLNLGLLVAPTTPGTDVILYNFLIRGEISPKTR